MEVKNIYIPVQDGKLVILKVNGHKFLVASSSNDELEESELLGKNIAVSLSEFKDEIVPKSFSVSLEESDNLILNALADEHNAGVVLAPEEIPLDDFLDGLHEVPWVH